jgi:hypothetical protein
MEIGDSEQGESSMPQGLSHGGTDRSSGTNNPTDQSGMFPPSLLKRTKRVLISTYQHSTILENMG